MLLFRFLSFLRSMADEKYKKIPDWAYVQETLMRNYFRECQRVIDFWSGRTALNFLQNAQMMSSTPKVETKDASREE